MNQEFPQGHAFAIAFAGKQGCLWGGKGMNQKSSLIGRELEKIRVIRG